MRTIPALLIALAAVPAWAQDNIPFRPDRAVLRCGALAGHELRQRGDAAPELSERFKVETMPGNKYRVTGRFEAEIDGDAYEVEVECEVSSAGVELFSMEIIPGS